MADKEEKVVPQTTAKDKPAKEKAKKPNGFVRFFKRIARYFREMKSELKKVVWPDRKTVMKNTGTVLLCSLAIGVCIWIFDFVMVTAVQMILSLFA